MTREVVVSARARDDLAALRRWIMTEADAATAFSYVGRLEAKLATLADFSARGSPRGNLGENVRSLLFDRTILIFYRVMPKKVRVLRISNGARQLADLRLT